MKKETSMTDELCPYTHQWTKCERTRPFPKNRPALEEQRGEKMADRARRKTACYESHHETAAIPEGATNEFGITTEQL